MRRDCLRAHQRGIEDERLETRHVGFVDFVSERDDFALLVGDRRGFSPDRIHLRDDPAGMRLNHLRAVIEVNFVAVVVRRIVARGDHHACARPQIADGERKFRRRARPVENERIAAVLRRNCCCEFGKGF